MFSFFLSIILLTVLSLLIYCADAFLYLILFQACNFSYCILFYIRLKGCKVMISFLFIRCTNNQIRALNIAVSLNTVNALENTTWWDIFIGYGVILYLFNKEFFHSLGLRATLSQCCQPILSSVRLRKRLDPQMGTVQEFSLSLQSDNHIQLVWCWNCQSKLGITKMSRSVMQASGTFVLQLWVDSWTFVKKYIFTFWFLCLHFRIFVTRQ